MHRDGESSVFAAVRLALIDGFRIKVGHQFSHSRTDCLGKVRYGSTHHFDGKVAGKFKQGILLFYESLFINHWLKKLRLSLYVALFRSRFDDNRMTLIVGRFHAQSNGVDKAT